MWLRSRKGRRGRAAGWGRARSEVERGARGGASGILSEHEEREATWLEVMKLEEAKMRC